MTIRDKIVLQGAARAISEASEIELGFILKESKTYDPEIVKMAKAALLRMMQQNQTPERKKIPCPFCKELIYPDATKCPFCRSAFSNKKAHAGSCLYLILLVCGAAFIVMTIGSIGYYFFQKKSDLFSPLSAESHAEVPALNERTPVAIETFYVQSKGEYGIEGYFTLMDRYGEATVADGILTLKINSKRAKPLRLNINKSRFGIFEVGIGDFKHDQILCDLGLIKYSDLITGTPAQFFDIEISFQTLDGEILTKTENVLFN